MIIDARELVPGAVVRADVCVVGGGPVGIAVTRELEASGLTVVQLESGGLEQDGAVDRLGDVARIEFGTVARLGNTRRFGGNANAWQVRTGVSWRGVRLLPLSRSDIEAPVAGDRLWPLGFDELQPYVARAETFCGLAPRRGPAAAGPGHPGATDLHGYAGETWARPEEAAQVIDDPDLRTAVFRFADAAALLGEWVAHAQRSDRTSVLLYATALEVLTDHTGAHATGIRAATSPGREVTVLADEVVLAAGCASTTQLLLASDRVRPEGLGNRHDLVGRYFMDHLLIQGGELWPTTPGDVARRTLYDLRVVDGAPVMGHLQLREEAVRRENLLNLSMLLFPREAGYLRRRRMSERQAAGLRAALAVREAVLRRQAPRRTDVARLAIGADGAVRRMMASARHPESSLGRGGWSLDLDRPWTCFEILHQAEQAPHRDNRMTLAPERDHLGARRLEVAWRWHDDDVAATLRAQQLMAAALRRSGWGEVRLAAQDGRPVVHSSSSNHFMGTTRMAADPRHGVVDAWGAVHGTPNLHVASSSVLPTGGFANVTLTAIALGLRTADGVVRRLRASTHRLAVVPDEQDGGRGGDGHTKVGMRHAMAAAALAAHAVIGVPEGLPPEPPAIETERSTKES